MMIIITIIIKTIFDFNDNKDSNNNYDNIHHNDIKQKRKRT